MMRDFMARTDNYMAKTDNFMARNDTNIQGLSSTVRNLENQMGQFSNELRNRPQGTFPSDTKNPRRDGKEHCKAITLRSGKELENPKENSGHEGEPSSIKNCEKVQENGEKSSEPKHISAQDVVEMPQHRSSVSTKFQQQPRRFEKKKQDAQFKKFLDVLKQLHINILLVEALEQMPNYVKFMKDILTKKQRLGEFETVALTKECSSFLQNKLPPKMKNPGSFTIPCTIENSYCGLALCNLGANINLMPMSVFKKLGIGKVKITIVTL
ncbi:uncharacterized protein LOC133785694 [Humulus lupulus]|uniref:uncharacterized protein LOC133785694 n=1 Tax=Humulus lupulus TaxID=3486 RepID=UPI002B40D804|nr:uncharacterized protein LOC133785694 [Humulus lupulus]